MLTLVGETNESDNYVTFFIKFNKILFYLLCQYREQRPSNFKLLINLTDFLGFLHLSIYYSLSDFFCLIFLRSQFKNVFFIIVMYQSVVIFNLFLNYFTSTPPLRMNMFGFIFVFLISFFYSQKFAVSNRLML
jgi:hypothetical protein